LQNHASRGGCDDEPEVLFELEKLQARQNNPQVIGVEWKIVSMTIAWVLSLNVVVIKVEQDHV